MVFREIIAVPRVTQNPYMHYRRGIYYFYVKLDGIYNYH
jgi:hypothetical protein